MAGGNAEQASRQQVVMTADEELSGPSAPSTPIPRRQIPRRDVPPRDVGHEVIDAGADDIA
jgi:hypothetical protein